jgi:hypothetical protein
MYEKDRIYIWQNQVGEYSYLNGAETTVTGDKIKFQTIDGLVETIWPTDTEIPGREGRLTQLFAHAGDLRPKYPPSGELSVLSLFQNQPKLEPA